MSRRPNSNAKTKPKKKPLAYSSGTRIVMPALVYAGPNEERTRFTCRYGGTHEGEAYYAVKELIFVPGDNIAVGMSHCGTGVYFAKNKTDAQAVIAWLKQCYEIE